MAKTKIKKIEKRLPSVSEEECQSIINNCCFILLQSDAVKISEKLDTCAAEQRRQCLHQNIHLYGCSDVSFASLFCFS